MADQDWLKTVTKLKSRLQEAAGQGQQVSIAVREGWQVDIHLAGPDLPAWECGGQYQVNGVMIVAAVDVWRVQRCCSQAYTFRHGVRNHHSRGEPLPALSPSLWLPQEDVVRKVLHKLRAVPMTLELLQVQHTGPAVLALAPLASLSLCS